MSFQSLSDLLTAIQQRPAWTTYHQYLLVQKNWRSVIAAKFLSKTRLVGISHQVLWVATESAAIAQHLSLQRYTLLKRLNGLLSEPLKDIRFSSATWFNESAYAEKIPQKADKSVNSPSLPPPNSYKKPKTPSEAFQKWADVVRQRSQDLPLCPHCQSPTESWELERWSMCGYCAFSTKSDL
ncbi:MAG: DciA family protein [Microcystaceae cyanobacterium]